MTHFWAKTTQDKKPGISVFEHMVNVGCVARCMVEAAPELLKRFQLDSAVVGVLSALHDLGKISPGFQRKCEVWLEENGLLKIARNGVWDTAMEPDHGKVTHAAVQKYLNDNGVDGGTSKFLSAVLGGHHGKLNPPNDRGFKPKGQLYSEERAESMSASVISAPFIIPFSFTRRALEGVAFLSIDDLSKAISRSIAAIRLMVLTSCFSAACFNSALLRYNCCINLTRNKYIVKKGRMSLI